MNICGANTATPPWSRKCVISPTVSPEVIEGSRVLKRALQGRRDCMRICTNPNGVSLIANGLQACGKWCFEPELRSLGIEQYQPMGMQLIAQIAG